MGSIAGEAGGLSLMLPGEDRESEAGGLARVHACVRAPKYAYMCMSVHACLCSHVSTCLCVHMPACMPSAHLCACLCVHVCVHAQVCVCVRAPHSSQVAMPDDPVTLLQCTLAGPPTCLMAGTRGKHRLSWGFHRRPRWRGAWREGVSSDGWNGRESRSY